MSELRPTITSKRLTAEPVVKAHAPVMVQVLNDPRIYQYLAEDPPSLERLERQYSFLEHGKSPDGAEHWLTWILKRTDAPHEPIGFIQATISEPDTATIAYVLTPKHWRSGYGREAVSALLGLVFSRYQVTRAVAEMDTRNEASIALVSSLGFRYARTIKDVAEFKGSTSHEYIYELTKAEWASHSALPRTRGESAG